MSEIEQGRNGMKNIHQTENMPVEKQPTAIRGRSFLGFFLNVVISLIVSAVVAIGAIYYYDQNYAQKVVAVDLKGFLEQQQEEFLDGKISKEVIEKRMDQLEKFVDQIPKHHPVILGDVVVRNIKVLKP